MARISQYDQDSTLNKLDKVVGTDSATGATKNYTIDSMIGLVNSEDLVNVLMAFLMLLKATKLDQQTQEVL